MNSILRPAIVLLICHDPAHRRSPIRSSSRGSRKRSFRPGRRQPRHAGRQGSSGSRLIGQPFSDPKYFWSRPSATSPQPYNGLASGGSNLGPLNPALTDAVKARIAALRAADPTNHAPVPVDLVTASASGLDPDISLAAAYYQADAWLGARRAGRSRACGH